jgi:hypothetical protein
LLLLFLQQPEPLLVCHTLVIQLRPLLLRVMPFLLQLGLLPLNTRIVYVQDGAGAVVGTVVAAGNIVIFCLFSAAPTSAWPPTLSRWRTGEGNQFRRWPDGGHRGHWNGRRHTHPCCPRVQSPQPPHVENDILQRKVAHLQYHREDSHGRKGPEHIALDDEQARVHRITVVHPDVEE